MADVLRCDWSGDAKEDKLSVDTTSSYRSRFHHMRSTAAHREVTEL